MADINLGRGLLAWLIELIKADYPDDWVRFCHLARLIERDASDDEAARRRLRVYRRYDIAGFSPSLGREVSASNELRKKFVEHFADVFRDHTWIGRTQGTLETRRLEPRQIRAGDPREGGCPTRWWGAMPRSAPGAGQLVKKADLAPLQRPGRPDEGGAFVTATGHERGPLNGGAFAVPIAIVSRLQRPTTIF